MTMKNNHLIVETEERNDLEEDSRETTMKYCPGDRDGVFVVEVQQGVRKSPGSGAKTSGAFPEPEIFMCSLSDQCALVHNPPDRFSDEETVGECDDSEYFIETGSPYTDPADSLVAQIRTGLAQSNTSLSKPSYCYTSQLCYGSGGYGYDDYAGYGGDEPARKVVEDNRLPKITAAVYKKTANQEAFFALKGIRDALNEVEKLDDKLRAEDDSADLKLAGKYLSEGREKRTEVRSVDYINEGFR